MNALIKILLLQNSNTIHKTAVRFMFAYVLKTSNVKITKLLLDEMKNICTSSELATNFLQTY